MSSKNVSKKQKKRVLVRGVPQRKTQAPPDVILSKCAEDYLRARSDPFAYQGSLPCVPDSLVLPSFKFKARGRAVVNAGTDGIAHVTLNPYHPTLDAQYLFGTTSTSVTAAQLSIATNQIAAFSQSPISNGTLQESRVRVVACQLRWKFAGQPLTRSGIQHAFCEVSNNSASTATMAQISESSLTTTDAVSGGWFKIDWVPKNEHDLVFQTHNAIDLDFCMILAASGVNPGDPFLVEVDAYYEMRVDATIAGLPLTPSHSDPTGFAAVSEVLSRPPQGQKSVTTASRIKEVKNALYSTASHVAVAGLRYAGNAATAAMAA